MANPLDQCETPAEFNTIKESLNKIPDTELALDILTNLESLVKLNADQSSALNKSNDELKRIQAINQALMIRATAVNSVIAPTTDVNYNSIDPVQSIIERI